MNKQYIFVSFIAIIVVSVGVIGWYFWGSTTSLKFDDDKEITSNEFDPKVLERELVIPATFPSAAKETLIQKAESLKAIINTTPNDITAWLDLAIVYKTVNDYEGAIRIWEYMNKVTPGLSVPYYNIADLNHYYLKDFQKAEKYFQHAVKMEPEQPAYYIGLYELYKYSYKQDTTAAADVLKEGILAVPSPENIGLMIQIAQYYREKGDNAGAVEWLTKGRDASKAVGNTELFERLNADLESLK